MLLAACAGKGANKTEPVPHKNIYSKDECTVNYESAISKCAGAPGTEYRAYRFVDDDLEHIHSEKRVAYYIPDEAARSAKTNELIA